MTLTVETMGARDRPDHQMDQLFGDGWPTFITADQVVKEHIGTVRRLFDDLELVLLDADDIPVAADWAVPLWWDGDPAHLPGGYSDSLVRAVEGHEKGESPDTLVVMAAQAHPGRRGQGLAGELVRDLPRIRQRPGEPVQLGHHQGVPGPAGGQRLPQSGAVPVGSGQAVSTEIRSVVTPSPVKALCCAVKS